MIFTALIRHQRVFFSPIQSHRAKLSTTKRICPLSLLPILLLVLLQDPTDRVFLLLLPPERLTVTLAHSALLVFPTDLDMVLVIRLEVIQLLLIMMVVTIPCGL